MDLKISRIETDNNGVWRFFNEAGDRIAQHVTPGHMARMYAEIHNDRINLTDLVARLPTTADGVAVVPGMTVWTHKNRVPCVAGYFPLRVSGVTDRTIYVDDNGNQVARHLNVYSSREAADKSTVSAH